MDRKLEILNEYINGNTETVAELYAHLKNQLLLLAYNYCRDKELSKDIVHDVFEKMLLIPIQKRREYFEGSANNIEAYISIVVKNKCLDTIKVKTNREKILETIRYRLNRNTENNSQEKFCKDGLLQMLNTLQPKEKEIIQLHLDGYTNEEISVQLNITYNTVKNNIYEAKRKMKKLWHVFMN